jgi:hypothetical protein
METNLKLSLSNRNEGRQSPPCEGGMVERLLSSIDLTTTSMVIGLMASMIAVLFYIRRADRR